MDHIDSRLGIARASALQSVAIADVNLITGTSGDDNLGGGDGSDSILGGHGDDALAGYGGDDTLLGGIGSDYLKGGDGDDLVNGGDGFDRAGFFGSTVGVHVDLNLQGQAQDTGQGMDILIGIEDLSGTPYGDTLTGDGGDNFLWGEGSAPSEPGDLLNGGGGDDVLDVRSDGTRAIGGAGVDTILIDDGGDGTMSNVHIDLNLQGEMQDTGNGMMLFKGFENAEGGVTEATNDTLIGDSAANILAGAGGDDSLAGGGGGDKLLGDGAIITSGPNSDGVIAEYDSGIGAGADTLDGGAGADTLVGGGGADMLTGGAGADRFVYLDLGDSTTETGDLITDLGKADIIDLSAIDADTTQAGDQAFTLAASFTDQAGQLVVHYDRADDLTHLLLDVDGDGLADADITVAGNQRHFENFVL
jgi:Ca2+-binding RTX toxin-like protein